MKIVYYNEFNFEPIGNIYVATLDGKLVSIDFNEVSLKNYIANSGCKIIRDPKSCMDIIEQLKEYFSWKRRDFDIEYEFLTGSEFQRQVWKELYTIPYGEVVSYKDIAVKVGKPLACRAVGSANGKNPIPIIFPCHRVINSNGKLGGYSGGLNIKHFLLSLETAHPQSTKKLKLSDY